MHQRPSQRLLSYTNFVPHRNYIKCCYLAGMPREEISLECTLRGFNDLPEALYDDIYRECKDIDGGKKMRDANELKFVDCKPPLIVDSVKRSFKYPDLFIDIVRESSRAYKKRHESNVTFKIFRLLGNTKLRTFLELSTSISMKLRKIYESWEQVEPQYGSDRMKAKVMYHYLYYFWRCNKSYMVRNSITVFDIAAYVWIDPYNRYYAPYRELIFSSETELLSYLGLVTKEMRISLTKDMWGKCQYHLKKALSSGNMVMADWITTVFLKLNDQIREDESAGGEEFYRVQLKKIWNRALDISTKRKSLDQVRTARIESREPEQDEPYKPKRSR